MEPIVFVFAGQGAHYYQMGKALYEQENSFRKELTTLNQLLFRQHGIDVLATLFANKYHKSDIFNDIEYTHSALFMIQYALGKWLIDNGIKPSYCCGISLGQFVALAVSQACDAQQMLLHIHQQALIIKNNIPKGGMTCLLNGAEKYYNHTSVSAISTLAGINSHNNILISHRAEVQEKLYAMLTGHDISYIPMMVQYPFHSSDMVVNELQEHCLMVSNILSDSLIPCYSTTTTKPFNHVDASVFDILRLPIEFPKTIETILSEITRGHFIDLSPAGGLINLIQQNSNADSNISVHRVLSTFTDGFMSIDSLQKAVA